MINTIHTESIDKAQGMPVMFSLAIIVGIVAGFGAIVFRYMIGFFHNLLFLGQISFFYNANNHTSPSPWGIGVILVPVLGALGVAFLVNTFAREARGHGMPEVIHAIYYSGGKIRPVVAAIKSLASALSIGSGGSVGREGPIIQIGSTLGSMLGQWVKMPYYQRVTLIAAGAGGGIAATFNTPIGGLAFALELMLPTITATSILPVVTSTIIATTIGRYFLGMRPAFFISDITISSNYIFDPLVFPIIIILGLIIGLVSVLFIKAIYSSEDLFQKIPGNYYTRHALGMLIMGIMIYILMKSVGHYYVQGVGYSTIEDILRGDLAAPLLLLLLAVLKLAATSLSLGSGASGGVFSPCLFIGAAIGGCFGTVVLKIFPGLPLNVETFAVIGMAGMIGGTTGAVMTAIIMLFEMTRDYNAVMPVILIVAVAYWVRRVLSPGSIYTLKLLCKGLAVPDGLASQLEK